MSRHEQELKALDMIENVIEYALSDLDSESGFFGEVEDFQASLIEYRGIVCDRITETSPAGGGDE